MKFEKIENCNADNIKIENCDSNAEIEKCETDKNIENCENNKSIENKDEKISLSDKFSKSFDNFKDKFSDFLIKDSDKIVKCLEVFESVSSIAGACMEAREINYNAKIDSLYVNEILNSKNEIVNIRKIEDDAELHAVRSETFEKIKSEYNLEEAIVDLGKTIECLSEDVMEGEDEFKEDDYETSENQEIIDEYSDSPPSDKIMRV